MNILFTRFPLVSTFGGAEIQTLSLMRGLAEKGHRVEFLGDCQVLLRQTKELQMMSNELHIGQPPVTKAAAISFAWRRKKMAQHLKDFFKEKPLPNAMCMLSVSEKILVTEWAAKQGTRVFWIEHDRIGRWLTKNPWLPALKKASKYATIICVSELSRKMYIDLGFDAARVVAIPNGIDLSRFAASEHVVHADAQVRVGTVARLSPEKGVDVLLSAVADMPQIDLTIVGTGPEEGMLHKIIDSVDQRWPASKDRLRIVSRSEDLGAFYQSLDLFVLPSSDHDPFGLVAAEAMSMGVATIVTDACGIAGYLENGENCLIVKANDRLSLANAINALAKDPLKRQRLTQAGKLAAEKLFSLQTMVKAYEELLQ